MTLTRSTFYWLWFLLFGVTSALATYVNTRHLGTEDAWLFGAGLGALLVGTKPHADVWVKPFDLAIGIIFFVVGLLGIMHAFNIELVNTASFVPNALLTPTKFLGLSLFLQPAVLHAALGFLSLRYGLKNPNMASSLELSTAQK